MKKISETLILKSLAVRERGRVFYFLKMNKFIIYTCIFFKVMTNCNSQSSVIFDYFNNREFLQDSFYLEDSTFIKRTFCSYPNTNLKQDNYTLKSYFHVFKNQKDPVIQFEPLYFIDFSPQYQIIPMPKLTIDSFYFVNFNIKNLNDNVGLKVLQMKLIYSDTILEFDKNLIVYNPNYNIVLNESNGSSVSYKLKYSKNLIGFILGYIPNSKSDIKMFLNEYKNISKSNLFKKNTYKYFYSLKKSNNYNEAIKIGINNIKIMR